MKPKKCPYIEECHQIVTDKQFKDYCLGNIEAWSREDCFKHHDASNLEVPRTPKEWASIQ